MRSLDSRQGLHTELNMEDAAPSSPVGALYARLEHEWSRRMQVLLDRVVPYLVARCARFSSPSSPPPSWPWPSPALPCPPLL